jgi:hypothetical protein
MTKTILDCSNAMIVRENIALSLLTMRRWRGHE